MFLTLVKLKVFCWIVARSINPYMTYRGVNPIIRKSTMNVIGTLALIRASLNMRKVLDIITIVTGILMIGILGGGFFTFKYVTSEQFKAKIMNEIMGNVSGLMPKVLDKGLPKTTGISIPKL